MYLIQPQFLGSSFLDCLTAKSLLILVNKSLPYSFAGTLYQHQLYFLVSDVLLDRPKLSSRERKHHNCLLLLSPVSGYAVAIHSPLCLFFHILQIFVEMFSSLPVFPTLFFMLSLQTPYFGVNFCFQVLNGISQPLYSFKHF